MVLTLMLQAVSGQAQEIVVTELTDVLPYIDIEDRSTQDWQTDVGPAMVSDP